MSIHICIKCDTVLTDVNWYKSHQKKHYYICKKCYKKIHPNNWSKWKQKYPKLNRELVRLSRRKLDKKRRKQIFDLLGNKCSNPFNIDHTSFEKEPDYIYCLQIDHVNGGGSEERKKIGGGSLMKLIYEKVKSGSKDYQLLCANCNWIKRYKNSENKKGDVEIYQS